MLSFHPKIRSFGDHFVTIGLCLTNSKITIEKIKNPLRIEPAILLYQSNVWCSIIDNYSLLTSLATPTH